MDTNAPITPLPADGDVVALAEATGVTAHKAVEIIPLDCGPTDREVWIENVAVRRDARETDFTGRIHDLSRDIAVSFDAASRSSSPRVVSLNLRVAITALKSMLATIHALDKYRHGGVQHITIEYADTATARDKPASKDAPLAASDRRIGELFLSNVDNLAAFETICRKEAGQLATLTGRELLGIEGGRCVRPNRCDWEAKLLGLAARLAGQVVKFTEAIETRHTRGRQHMLVNYVGNVPTRKSATRAVTHADESETRAVSVKLVAIGQFVEKARKVA